MKTICIFSLLVSFGIVSITHATPATEECSLLEQKRAPPCCKEEKDVAGKQYKEYEKNMGDCIQKFLGNMTASSSADAKITLSECIGECFFNSSGMLTPDLKLDKDMISKKNKEFGYSDPKWEAIDNASLKKCYDKSVVEGKESGTCKSGSYQFLRCTIRERFINCPKDFWTESEECKAYKDVLERCDNVVPEQ